VKRRSRGLLRGGIALALAAAWCSRAALAQTLGEPSPDEGPVVVGELRKYERLHLDPPTLALNSVNSYSHDRDKTGGNTSEFSEAFFQQSIEVNTQGYFIHPNFVELNLGGTFGVNESFIDSDGDSSQSTSDIYTWDLKSIILRNGEAPITLFSQRNQSWISREFGPTLQNTSTSTGASIDFKKTAVPTHLEYSHNESEQTGVEGTEDFRYTRDSFSWFSSAQPRPNHNLTWNYNFDSVDQASGDGANPSSYETHQATLADQITFGHKDRSSLNSTLNFTQQSGTIENQQFRWDERLRLQHSDDFSTRYQYTLSKYDYPGSDRTSNRFLTGFTHKLYDSLTTNGNAGVEKSDFSGGGDVLFSFADLLFDYRKKVPYGNLSASLGFATSRTESDSTTTNTPISNRPFTFTDPAPIVINGNNVQVGAITDPSGLVLYRPGVDYTVQKFSDRVQIDRVVGGLIPNGQTVLVDYALGPLPASTTETNSFSSSLRYDFDDGFLSGLGVFARINVSDQSISTSSPSSFTPNDFTDTALGADYRFWHWIVGYEHEFYDSTINPYDADRFYGRYSRSIDYDTTVALNTAFTSIDYTQPVDHVKLFTVSGQVTRNISRELSATLTALYRDESQDTTRDVSGFEQQLQIDWRHRQTHVYILLRNSMLDTESQDTSFQFFQLGIRREF
jgi:hypothetical protein